MPTILVITPDALGHHLLDALLSLHGYDVVFAECGRKGLDFFRTICPDVVVLDLKIHDMKAVAVVRQIRRLHSHQPVIVLTGNGTSESEQRIRSIGVNEMIGKEVAPRHIVGILKRLLKPVVQVRDLSLTHGEWKTIS